MSVETENVDLSEATLDKQEPERPKLTPGRIYIIVAGLAIALFCGAVDSTIVATALPTIANHFNSLSKISWVVTANLLTATAFQPLYGRLSDIFGRKETLLIALGIFETGTVISSLASRIEMLIVSRAISGIGSAGIIVMVQIVIADIVSLQERGKYAGLISIAFGIASVVGPILGGLFTDHLSWRWCFYINLPLGAIAATVVLLLVKTPAPIGDWKTKIRRIDFKGAVLLISGLVCLILAINFGGTQFAWSSPQIISLFAVSVVLLSIFVYVEIKTAFSPLIPISSGIFLLPFMMGLVSCSIISGLVISRTGYYRMFFIPGILVFSVGTSLITTFTSTTGKAPQVVYLLIAGIGMGSTMQSTILCAQVAVKRELLAVATGLIMFARILSGTIGVALVSLVLKISMNPKLAEFVKSNPQDYALIEASKQSAKVIYASGTPVEAKDAIIAAYVFALRNVFIMTASVSFLGFVFALFTRHIPLTPPQPEQNQEKTEKA
ncbi:hypothetical protein BB559_002865 [Furculomyces boomerangus]|uniref:Major facilitator superfamily (MFS) profile domain-containing protein n=1 Tax=Furculomyces boomerangus TaxID=61424 RepID=A0A2T9YDP9_9FUNG|nr:hypothetical protein BB559_004594 [Furculomyces boomerangus]PVU94979.1 hypothetical protein BB559_002865 [Furculomyces boomerangus]